MAADNSPHYAAFHTASLGVRGVAAAVRAEHAVSLVWTGPTTDVTGLRATRSALNTLVANATQSLVLVSFVSYDVAELTAGLADAIERGVEVTLETTCNGDPSPALSHIITPNIDGC